MKIIRLTKNEILFHTIKRIPNATQYIADLDRDTVWIYFGVHCKTVTFSSILEQATNNAKRLGFTLEVKGQ